MAMLEVNDIKVYYGMIQAIKGVSFHVDEGEVIALIGANGAGKTTILHTVSGLLTPKEGTITFEGQDLVKIPGHKIVSMGMAHVPEGRRVFANLSVYENLKLGAYTRKDKNEIAQSLEMVYESFPRLKERRNQSAGTLSGGEQQRLALAKVLLLQPRLLLMDEPTKGLDAEYKQELGDILKKLKAHGITIFMISHDVEFVAEYADRVGLFFQGNVVTCKSARDFFAGNSFYTTAANRMARHYFPDVVTGKEVAACLKARL